MPSVTDVVKNLIIINVIVFVGTAMLPADWRSFFALHLPISNLFQPFQLVTHFFMHGDFIHIFFNMYGLFLFGSALEALWGSKKLLFFYLFTAFGAAALYLLTNYLEYLYMLPSMSPELIAMTFGEGAEAAANGYNFDAATLGKFNGIVNGGALGASGAVFGLMMGYAINFPENRLGLFPFPIMIAAKHFVLIYGAVELYMGFGPFNTGIAHFAHIGGALSGMLLILYWDKYGSRL